MDSAQRQFYRRCPPTVAGMHIVQTDATAVTADNFNWTTALASAGVLPAGPVWLELEAVTETAWIRFKASATAAATTTDNGAILPVGQPRHFLVSPKLLPVIDHIAAGTGSLKVQVVSKMVEREDI